MKKPNLIYSTLIFALGCFVFFYSKRYFLNDSNMPVGPEVFPRVISIGLMILGVIIFVSSIYGKEAKGNQSEQAFKINWVRLLSVVLVFILYCLLTNLIGFILTSAIFVAYFMYVLGCRKKILMAVYSLVMPGIIYFFFHYYLYIPLPLGILFS